MRRRCEDLSLSPQNLCESWMHGTSVLHLRTHLKLSFPKWTDPRSSFPSRIIALMLIHREGYGKHWVGQAKRFLPAQIFSGLHVCLLLWLLN